MGESSMSRNSNTPNIRGSSASEVSRSREETKPTPEKKKRIKLLEPVIGNEKSRTSVASLKTKTLGNKMDIAYKYLDMLMQPNNFMNSEALKITFRAEEIINLCNVAEEIIVSQPIILQAKPPLKIFGDIHGQFTDLMTFFAYYGTPHENGKKKDI